MVIFSSSFFFFFLLFLSFMSCYPRLLFSFALVYLVPAGSREYGKSVKIWESSGKEQKPRYLLSFYCC